MRLADMPEFKETEIGQVPVDWSVAQVATLANVDSESLSNKTAAEFSFRYISLGDVDAGKLVGGYSPITFAEAPSRARRVVKSGDILFATVRPNLKGHFFARRIDGNVVASTGFAVIRARDGIAAPAFIYQSLLSGNVDAQIEKLTVGSNYPAVNSADVKGLLLPAPPLPEQQKIAAILTSVDDKLDVIARQIGATQTLKQGLMQTLLNRGVGSQDVNGCSVPHAEFQDSELGKIPAGWAVAPLGELIEKLMDFRGRTPKKLGMDWGGGVIPALSANNVRMGYIDFDRECYLGSDELYAAWMVQGDTRKNDLVFTMEAPLGNVAVIPDDSKYILSQRVVLLRANQRIKHSYLFQYLQSDTFGKILEANSTGTTAKGIQQKRLVQLPVVLPPLQEQERIADMLGSIDRKLDALLSKQFHHQTLKRGLMQKLLTGEWRVRLDVGATAT